MSLKARPLKLYCYTVLK